MLEYEKAEMQRIEKQITELNDKKEKLDAEIKQLWKDKTELMTRMYEQLKEQNK